MTAVRSEHDLAVVGDRAAAAKVRVRYAKLGRLRFVSAIDLGRLWERALRKADLPIAYSEGFSPHPKVSFPDALPLGYASTGEYAELVFAGDVPVGPSLQALDAAFPEGLRILAAGGVADDAPRLSKWLRASAWRLTYPEACAETLGAAVAAARAADKVLVERERKGTTTTVDVRPAIHLLVADGGTVDVVVAHVEPPVRPTEVHLALSAHADEHLPQPTLAARVAQGSPVDGGLTEAMTGVRYPAISAADADPASPRDHAPTLAVPTSGSEHREYRVHRDTDRSGE